MEKNAFTDVLDTKLLAADALGIQELWPSKERATEGYDLGCYI